MKVEKGKEGRGRDVKRLHFLVGDEVDELVLGLGFAIRGRGRGGGLGVPLQDALSHEFLVQESRAFELREDQPCCQDELHIVPYGYPDDDEQDDSSSQ